MPETGQITDEGLARLRATIGIAVPHTQPPHYFRPNEDSFRHVAESYGDDNPLWCDPEYGARTRWGGPIAPPPLVGGDTLIGEDEVTAVAPSRPALMKGDPAARRARLLLGERARMVGAAAPDCTGCFRRNALVARAGQAERIRRAGRSTNGPAQVFRDDDGRRSCRRQYRLMIRTERSKARERKKYDDGRDQAVHRRGDRRDRRAVRARARRAAASHAGGRTWPRATTVGPDGQGPADGHRHGLLARRHGHGPVRRAAPAARLAQPAAHPALLPPR